VGLDRKSDGRNLASHRNRTIGRHESVNKLDSPTGEYSSELRQAMVAQVMSGAQIANPAILDAMEAVPREAFAPSYFLYADGAYRLLRSAADEKDWLAQTYQDQSLVTQIAGTVHADDADAEAGGWQGAPTCSASQPSLVASMIDMLKVEPGARVLEIGTGTGYNAALLCELTGSGNVYSVEYDPSLAAKAVDHLNAAGYAPRVVVGDGSLGYRDAAPFDAIVTTCSFPAVYPAWLEQLSSNGAALVSLITGIPVGILTVLTVDGEGSATGRIVSQRAWFMPTRTEPTNHALALSERGPGVNATSRKTDVRWTDVETADGLYVLTALLLDAHLLATFTDDGGMQYGLYADDGSTAIEHNGRVEESGPRRLWADLEQIAQQWARLGQPDRDDFELSISYRAGAIVPSVVHPASGWATLATGITGDNATG
jgi:protein-L-isoaspartate O-methyltransferase